MKTKKDVKIIKVSFCILFRVEEKEEEKHKNKEREVTNRSINEFKRRELTATPVFPLKEHSLNEALPLLTRTAPP